MYDASWLGAGGVSISKSQMINRSLIRLAANLLSHLIERVMRHHGGVMSAHLFLYFGSLRRIVRRRLEVVACWKAALKQTGLCSRRLKIFKHVIMA